MKIKRVQVYNQHKNYWAGEFDAGEFDHLPDQPKIPNNVNEPLMLDFPSCCGAYRLTFEDDGKVAYAYLKHDKSIVAAVWLYNRQTPPSRAEWLDRNNIPFANCEGYVSEGGLVRREVGQDDVIVDWKQDEKGPIAYIYVFDDLYAVVGVGDRPGYARFAVKDGPLAQVMEIEGSET